MRFVQFVFVAMLLGIATADAYSQPGLPDPIPPPRRDRRLPESLNVESMLAKQRLERNKRDHREMLERGEQALRLANQLEASFTEKKNITPEDKARLESLQDVVEKIRKELGADDDDGVGAGEEEGVMKPVEDPRPSNIEEAFKYLQTSTIKLVDELKKTTRFTISAIAIQSSNSVIRLVKFLRFRR